MKQTLILLMLLALGINLHAQDKNNFNAPDKPYYIKGLPNLIVGDMLPDFKINKIINAAKTTANTADFKDQLLIIDFWATNCSSCIEAMPHMQELQDKFGDKIKILPVTYEKKEDVKNFWKTNEHTKKLKLPSVVEDSTFRTYFKHYFIPHEVWVYKGNVIAITNADVVNAKNIERVLEGKEVNFPLKYDFYQFDELKPLFSIVGDKKEKSDRSISKYTAIAGFREEASVGDEAKVGISRDSLHNTFRIYLVNVSVPDAYGSLFKILKVKAQQRLEFGIYPNRYGFVEWEVADKSKYLYDKSASPLSMSEWMRKNAICFEMVDVDTGQTNEQIYWKAVATLNALLGLNVRAETRGDKRVVFTEVGYKGQSK